MVVLDNAAAFGKEKVPFHLPKFSLPGTVALAAAILVLGSLTVRGFSDNGFRLASQNAWRFACIVFFAAMMAGPLGRLIPAFRRLRQDSCPLFLAFCASYGVYLLAVLLPNAFGPQSIARAGGLTLFVLFGAGVTLVMALALTPRLAVLLGGGVLRALLGVSAAWFWLVYALMGLAHLSHPHRPDGFYGFSLSLMLVALLVRFADNWMQQRPREAAVQ